MTGSWEDASWLETISKQGQIVKYVLTVKGRSGWRRRSATLAAFWPHNDAQCRHSLRISEQCFSRSTNE